jgi:hypothetical protein
MEKMSFEEWLKYGIDNQYCTEQFCSTHDSGPLTYDEDTAWAEGFDPCMHVVRLGSEEDW